jgi:hypothetical protein
MRFVERSRSSVGDNLAPDFDLPRLLVECDLNKLPDSNVTVHGGCIAEAVVLGLVGKFCDGC